VGRLVFGGIGGWVIDFLEKHRGEIE